MPSFPDRTVSNYQDASQTREGSISTFQYVREWDSKFLALFPHRFDYIFAEHPEPGQSPNWQTESRHPLSDRLLLQSAYQFGVRFGPRTRYSLLDIDTSSPYHPRQDPLAISRILAALEPLGLVTYIACTSSDSGGLHLYFPFQEAQNSWETGAAIATLLNNAGFKLKSGTLEVFPNPKPYAVESKPSLFNAHRLPMQAGSYLLNQEFQPTWSDSSSFVQQWQFAQKRNDFRTASLQQILKQAKRRSYRISGKADKFINDLNAEIELGWTGSGQTNHLLGRITMKCYIFHHVLSGGKPLEGQALTDEIVEIARSLPGYQEWCDHQHEIEKRAADWARCIENSHYFHYGEQKGKYTAKPAIAELPLEAEPSWNQQQSEAARDRIGRAIADLMNRDSLPANATARFQALTHYGIGGGTLYRHRDLWHPEHLWKSPPDPPPSYEVCLSGLPSADPDRQNPTSLLLETDRNAKSNHYSSDFQASDFVFRGGNFASDEGLSHLKAELARPDSSAADADASLSGIQHVQRALFDVKATLDAGREASRVAREQAEQIKNEAHQERYIARMKQFLASGDPILMAEAQAWAEINPGILGESTPHPISSRSSTGQLSALVQVPVDLSEVLTAITLQLQRLKWNPTQVQKSLLNCFGKRSRAMLDELELVEWLAWLENQN